LCGKGERRLRVLLRPDFHFHRLLAKLLMHCGNRVLPDEAAFREWAESPEYLEIAKDRKAGSTATVLLVKGLPSVNKA
jgi:Domain of unknown function (DUF1330)